MTETSVSGIVGNTQQAAKEATVAREATKTAWQEHIFTHVVIGFVLLIISYLLMTSLSWNFFWKLVAGAGLIYSGGKLASVSVKLKWYWPNILRGVGYGIIALILLQSGFTQMIGTGINKIEEMASGTVTPSKPLSAKEQAQQVAVAAQEAEVAEAQRLARVAAQKQAEIDAERAYDESFFQAKSGPCLMVHTEEMDCVTVEFEAFTQYDRYAPSGHCVMADGTGIEWIPRGNGWHRYRATRPTVVQFFTAEAERCGS